MSKADRFQDDQLSLDLLHQVIKFKKIYFAANWAHYETAIPGTLRIVPNDALQAVLRRDYQQMQEIFPTQPLSFEQILERIGELEQRTNRM